MNSHHPQSRQHRWWRSPTGLALLVFLAIAAFFLITEHTAHTFGALPFLLLLACPLMHVFMHGGHGGHAGHAKPGGRGEEITPSQQYRNTLAEGDSNPEESREFTDPGHKEGTSLDSHLAHQHQQADHHYGRY